MNANLLMILLDGAGLTGSNLTNAGSNAALSTARTNSTFALRFLRDTNAVDVTLVAEGAYAMSSDALWTGFATNIGGSWGGATNMSELGPGPVTVTAFDPAPATNRFLRLRVTRP